MKCKSRSQSSQAKHSLNVRYGGPFLGDADHRQIKRGTEFPIVTKSFSSIGPTHRTGDRFLTKPQQTLVRSNPLKDLVNFLSPKPGEVRRFFTDDEGLTHTSNEDKTKVMMFMFRLTGSRRNPMDIEVGGYRETFGHRTRSISIQQVKVNHARLLASLSQSDIQRIGVAIRMPS